MKKLFLFAISSITIFSGFTVTYAYTPTSQDQITLVQLKNTLDQINSGNVTDIWNFSTQIKKLQPMVANDPRITYLLQELHTHLYGQFSIAKIKTKQASKSGWNNFLAQYNTGIVAISMEDKCFGRYNTLDNISFANNFPTALTVATRYRESHCGYYLPKNGDGPFQILAKEYGTGEITEETFTQSVQDFIDFSKTKYANYKSKVDINISYTGTDLNSIISHGGFYNGGTISGRIVFPNAPKYVYEGYANYNSGQYASGAIRHGLLPKFLKTLEFELNNYY
ncbi:hypothetical protein P148_SR1C00001G0700 [candidate division SR1 bacterium RAAC1_SR1_1]|nr:hypothetical protein P148_SR1C00001G0700 [candidate division SR1 bacterium RAAC1_SR1_1]